MFLITNIEQGMINDEVLLLLNSKFLVRYSLFSSHYSCASSHRSASRAAIQPVPAAVTA